MGKICIRIGPLTGIAALAAAVACGSPDSRVEAGAPSSHTAPSPPRRVLTTKLLDWAERHPARTRGASGYAITVDRRATARGLRSPATAIETVIPGDAASPFEVSSGALHLQVRREGASAIAAKLDRGAVVYSEAWPGVDALVFARERGVEELLVARSSARELAYRIDVPSGYRLSRPDPRLNLVELRDPGGVARLRFLALVAWDADGKSVSVELRAEPDRIVLRIPGEARLPVTVDPEWQSTGDMALSRSGHTATLLPTGKVLVVGGELLGVGLAELYDPDSETFSAAGSLTLPRSSGHTATLLESGQVLIVGGAAMPAAPLPAPGCQLAGPDGGCVSSGGAPSTALAEAELYDPGAATFTEVGPPAHARTDHAATLLTDGTVLLTGGVSPASDPSEIFDPSSGAFYDAGRLEYPRTKHSATLLDTGEVLIAGYAPSLCESGGPCTLPPPELFFPATGGYGTLSPAPLPPPPPGEPPPPPQPQSAVTAAGPLATLLPSGSVAFAGVVFSGTSSHSCTIDLCPIPPGSLLFGGVVFNAGFERGGCSAGERATVLPTGDVLFAAPGLLSLWKTSSTACAGVTVAGAPASGSTATLLPTGAVLFTGGGTASAALFEPDSESRVSTGALEAPRQHHAAALLPSGKVLLAGGVQDAERGAAAEIYDPVTRRFEPAGPTHSIFERASAVTLPSGFVFVAGAPTPGVFPPPAHPLERFDPSTRLFSIAGDANAPVDLAFAFEEQGALVVTGSRVSTYDAGTNELAPFVDLPAAPTQGARRSDGYALLANASAVYLVRRPSSPGSVLRVATIALKKVVPSPTVTMLPGGDTLLVGGDQAALLTATDIEVPVDGPARPRSDHSATLLDSGNVLVAGGTQETTAELYDPATARFRPAASMLASRWGHSATRLPSGEVFVASRSSAELYDPDTDTWTDAATVPAARDGHTATLLPDGHVLFAGGLGVDGKASTATELYDARSDLAPPAASLLSPRAHHTATLLPSGDVLLVGGDSGGSGEIFAHDVGTLSRAGSMLAVRSRHTATLLPSGRVLVTGGFARDGSRLRDAEIYDPGTATFSAAPSLQVARAGHATVLLPSGRLLLAGGVPAGGGATLELYDPIAPPGTPSTTVDGPPLSGDVGALLLPSGDVLVSGGGASFRFAVATSTITDLRAGPAEVFGATALGPAGSLFCGPSGCDVRRANDAEPSHLPHASSGGSSLTPLLDGSALLHGRNEIGGGYTLRYGLVPSRAVRPRIASPGHVTAGTDVTIRGAGFMHPSAVGSEGRPSRPDIFPVLYFVPATTTVPILTRVTAWTDDTVTWHVPSTPYHGPGWLYAVVQGVPSEGAFVVVGPTPSGSACSSDPECGTGHCTEGICCDVGCAGGCQSCRAARSGLPDGKCGSIPQGASPRFGCEHLPGDVCSPTLNPTTQVGECDGTGECLLPDETVTCHTARVPSGVCIKGACAEPPPATCSSDGFFLNSPARGSTSCSPFRCEDATAGRTEARCFPNCTSKDQCAPPFACTSDGLCRACTPNQMAVKVEGPQPILCGDYLCRDGECLVTCVGDADCSPWAACRTGRCLSACDASGEGVKVNGGDAGIRSASCAPYRCKDGACLGTCSSHADCAPAYRCGPAGRCEADSVTALTAPSDPSCACTTVARRATGGRPGAPSGGVALAALTLGLLRRRRLRRLRPSALTLALLGLSSGCASSSADRSLPVSRDASGSGSHDAASDRAPDRREASTQVDASGDAGAPSDAGAPAAPDAGTRPDSAGPRGPLGTLPFIPGVAMVRVAHFVDDGPAIHVCARSSGPDAGRAWLPVTGSAQLGGLSAGLARWQVTAYAPVPAGTVDVRIVAAPGGPTCIDHILAETTLSPLGERELGILLLRGSVSHLDVSLLLDRPAPDPAAPRFRVVHAAHEQGSIDVFTRGCWLSQYLYYDDVFASHAPTSQTDCAVVDEFGYASVPSAVPGTPEAAVLSVFDSTSGWSVDQFSLPVAVSPFAPGRVSTAFLHDDPSTSSGLGLVVCEDTWPSLDALTTCLPAPRAAEAAFGSVIVRLTNASVTDSFDVCLKRSDVPWLPAHRLFSSLGYLGERATVLQMGIDWAVSFVPVGAPCGTTTPFSDRFRLTGSQGVQVIAVPGVPFAPDAAYSAPPGLSFLPGFSCYPFPGCPASERTWSQLQTGDVVSADLGDIPNPRLEYDFGPVMASPDPSLLTALGGLRAPALSLSPSQPIGVYTRAILTPGVSIPTYGQAVLRWQTSVPVVTRADHSYSMIFARGVSTQPTNLLVCDLSPPPPDVAPAPCDSYTLVAVP